MAFKANYGRDRAERQRAARARSDEKQRKKEEKRAQRKVERELAEPRPDEKKVYGSLADPVTESRAVARSGYRDGAVFSESKPLL